MAVLTLRPLSTGEILDVSFALYRKHFVALATIAIIVQGIPILLNVYTQSQGGMFANLGLYFITLVASMVGAAIGMGASMQIIADSYLGKDLTANDALKRAVPFLGRLIMLTLIGTFLVGIGIIAFVVPGIIIACGIGVAAQALVLEDLPSAERSLRRSWELTKGFRDKVFMTFFVVMLLIYLSSIAAGFVAGLVGFLSGFGTAFLMVLLVLYGLFAILVYPYVYAAATVLYYDLRVRKEGFDLEMLEQALKPA